MYVIHLVTTIAAIGIGFIFNYSLFLSHLPFLIMTLLGVILIPFGKRNRMKTDELKDKLEVANQKISELAIVDERNRIARDLHDTLGQKLSIIGLKSELSAKLIDKDPVKAKQELADIHNTSRHALKEVREIISNMKHVSLETELKRIEEILEIANIECITNIDIDISRLPLLIENVLSISLRETVNNIVKHSNAKNCQITLTDTKGGILLYVMDDGTTDNEKFVYGNGLTGMEERLSFINGELSVRRALDGFHINISVPKVLKEMEVVSAYD